MKLRLKHLPVGLIVLIVVLVLIFSFFVYEGMKAKEIEEKQYIVDEVVQSEDIIPDETEEPPVIEQTEEEVEVINEVTIEIKNLKFYPDNITISPGTTVTWVNKDTAAHKVVAYDRLFYGPRLEPGDRYAFTFTKEGTHRYFDAAFPKIGRGSVIVQEEPLPITGGVVGVDLSREESNAKFALLILLFVIMVLGLSHGIYKHKKN